MTSGVQKRENLMEPLVFTAGVLGVIQGTGWILLSISAIVLHTGAVTTETGTPLVDIGATIYEIYLDKNYAEDSYFDDIIVKPAGFSYFMALYLVFSICLLVVSSVVLWVSITGKGEAFYVKTIGSWTLVVAVLSLLDVIMLCLLSHDYAKVKERTELFVDAQMTVLLTSVGIVMTLAARGFVLWVVNVILTGVLGKYCYDMYNKGVTENQPVIDAYANGSRPWLGPSMYDDASPLEFDNKGFRDDNDISVISPPTPPYDKSTRNYYDNDNRDMERNNVNNRAYSQANLRNTNNNNDNYWNNSNPNRDGNGLASRPYSEHDSSSTYGQSAPLKTAKIGRQAGQRSPPLNVAPPFIPDPDYSPPGSPKVRGVLRPKSNYMMY